ncbi:MAG TPA: hypothetical protein VF214_07510 [Edaphobacter sp.]
MESRRQRANHKRNPSLKDDVRASDSVHADLPHIAALIADGEITVGILDPVGCVAVATDCHNTLAMLKRRPDETLAQLITRLDQAIERAWTEEIYTDEINAPVSFTFRAARERRG